MVEIKYINVHERTYKLLQFCVTHNAFFLIRKVVVVYYRNVQNVINYVVSEHNSKSHNSEMPPINILTCNLSNSFFSAYVGVF